MSYQVLARKWRPQAFSELVGQTEVLAALIHGLNENLLHHAYLFTGTRGVGKTTVARIVAKCLNCEQGVSSTPCRICTTCREIQEGRFIDLIEIDAASRTKVEDTRELLDNVQYAPTQGRFKVYLIDEVHMLSTHSFNALLKTLEEPPPHVKFLLATTDPQKLPVTVLSRCLQFHLKPIPTSLIRDQLRFILNAENIKAEDEALNLIAKAGEGSLRDALSLLDQAIAQGEGEVQAHTTANMLGIPQTALLYQLAEAIAQRDAPRFQSLLAHLDTQPIQHTTVLSLITELWYELSLKQAFSDYESVDWDTAILARLSTMLSPQLTQLLYQMGLQGKKDLPFAPQAKIGLNMTLLRMFAFQVDTPSPPATPMTAQNVHAQSQPSSLLSSPSSHSTALEITAETWPQVVSALDLHGMSKQLLAHMSFDSLEGQQLSLSLFREHQTLLNSKQQERIQQALSTYFQQPCVLQISIIETPRSTPATEKAQAEAHHQLQLQEKLEKDPHLDFIKNNFNAIITRVQSNQS